MYKDLIGKKFEYGGRGPHSFDCYGLCIEIYKRMGIELLDYLSTDDWKSNSENFSFGKKDFVRLEKPESFCLVTLMIHKPFVSHIGVVLEDCRHFINSFQKRNVCIEDLESPRWANRIDGFWRYAKN